MHAGPPTSYALGCLLVDSLSPHILSILLGGSIVFGSHADVIGIITPHASFVRSQADGKTPYQLLDEKFVTEMLQPVYEEFLPSYGYLMWLNTPVKEAHCCAPRWGGLKTVRYPLSTLSLTANPFP